MPAHETSVVVAGVSGVGKSTVGRALAAALGVAFLDADDLHPPANVAKMRRGEALDDADRAPWLDLVGGWLAEHPGGVVACSALKRAYRDRLRAHLPDGGAPLTFVMLTVSTDVLVDRRARRPEQRVPTAPLGPQLATLEALDVDETGFTQSVDPELPTVVAEIAARLS